MKAIARRLAVTGGSAVMLLSGATTSTAYAGDSEWATAGKILAGVVTLGILRDHVFTGDRRPVHTKTVVHTPPHRRTGRPYRGSRARPIHSTVIVQQSCPAPVVRDDGPVWHEGHYIYVPKREWVDTSYEVEEWVQGHRRPDGVWVDGHKIRRTVKDGYWRETQEKVWVEAGYR